MKKPRALIPADQPLYNSPNPFSGWTTIHYSLSADSRPRTAVSLSVYDLSGRLVRTLVDDVLPTSYSLPVPSEIEGLPASVVWDGKDGSGNKVPPGIYMYRLEAGDCAVTKKTVLLR